MFELFANEGAPLSFASLPTDVLREVTSYLSLRENLALSASKGDWYRETLDTGYDLSKFHINVENYRDFMLCASRKGIILHSFDFHYISCPVNEFSAIYKKLLNVGTIESLNLINSTKNMIYTQEFADDQSQNPGCFFEKHTQNLKNMPATHDAQNRLRALFQLLRINRNINPNGPGSKTDSNILIAKGINTQATLSKLNASNLNFRSLCNFKNLSALEIETNLRETHIQALTEALKGLKLNTLKLTIEERNLINKEAQDPTRRYILKKRIVSKEAFKQYRNDLCVLLKLICDMETLQSLSLRNFFLGYKQMKILRDKLSQNPIRELVLESMFMKNREIFWLKKALQGNCKLEKLHLRGPLKNRTALWIANIIGQQPALKDVKFVGNYGTRGFNHIVKALEHKNGLEKLALSGQFNFAVNKFAKLGRITYFYEALKEIKLSGSCNSSYMKQAFHAQQVNLNVLMRSNTRRVCINFLNDYSRYGDRGASNDGNYLNLMKRVRILDRGVYNFPPLEIVENTDGPAEIID